MKDAVVILQTLFGTVADDSADSGQHRAGWFIQRLRSSQSALDRYRTDFSRPDFTDNG
jgi:hypothetical protein